MTSKERVKLALEHKSADRVPLDFGGVNNSSIHHIKQSELKKYLGLKDSEADIKAISQGVVVPDESLLDYFHVDTRSIYINETRSWIENQDSIFTDMWGIGYKLNPDGYYYNFAKHPLFDADNVKDIEKYTFPEPNDRMLYGLREKISANKDKCLILEGLREPIFGLPSWLRGTTNFYMDLLSNQAVAEALLDRIVEYYLKLLDFLLDRVGDDIDIVKFADDLGSQTNLLISPETYRKLIKPRQAVLYKYAKEKCGCKILLHSCGAISSIIPDLIEIGVDAINPVQISASGMEPSGLKRKFGKEIAFWGGGIDTQNTLKNATAADIKKEVKNNIEIFKEGGGYVFAQVHNIMPDVPVENIIAMFEAYRENSGY
jgi:uroporphyrinogen decarboxylase